MSTREKKTQNIKIRMTKTEENAVIKIAEENHSTVSDVIRNALFNNKNDMNSSIIVELYKQKTYNLIQHTPMPKESRENIVKELNEYEYRN